MSTTLRDRVFFCGGTAAIEFAILFAVAYPGRGPASVYEVEPIGEIERDSSVEPLAEEQGSLWLHAPSARVVRVIERNVKAWPGLRMDNYWVEATKRAAKHYREKAEAA
jgi:hypothetical protein